MIKRTHVIIILVSFYLIYSSEIKNFNNIVLKNDINLNNYFNKRLLDDSDDISITYKNQDEYYCPMSLENSITVEVKFLSDAAVFRFLYVTEDDETFGLNEYQSDKSKEMIIPPAKKIKVIIKNKETNQIIKILTKEIKCNLNETYKKRLDQILVMEDNEEKFNHLKTYFSLFRNNTECDADFDTLIETIAENLDKALDEIHFQNKSFLISPNIFISLLNQIIINQFEQNRNDNRVKSIISLLKQSLAYLNERKLNNNDLFDENLVETIKSYYRNLDELISKSKIVPSLMEEIREDIVECLNLVEKYVSKFLQPTGNNLEFIAKEFKVFLISPNEKNLKMLLLLENKNKKINSFADYELNLLNTSSLIQTENQNKECNFNLINNAFFV